jgi:hypothetical protein
MKILLVCPLATFGGVETLLIRMANNFVLNHQVVILVISKKIVPNLSAEISNDVKILHVRSFYAVLPNKKQQLRAELNKLFNNSPDVIFSYNMDSLLFSLFVKKLFDKQIKLLTGVYHPNEYSWKPRFFNLSSYFFKKIIKQIPVENILFMNEACRKSTSNIDKRFLSSPIVPLPIKFDKCLKGKNTYKKYKIVSIGRIASFKTYNFLMLDVMKRLLEVNEDFEYHIYGHGELEDDLKSEIIRYGLAHKVFFYGTLPYNKFQNVLSDAFIFIGMGTSIIEASAQGVPSVLAIAGIKEEFSYGWFHEQLDYNVGEPDYDKTMYGITDLILSLYNNQYKYLEYSILSLQKACLFSEDVILEDFLDKFNFSINFSNDKYSLEIKFLCILIERLFIKFLPINDPNSNQHDVFFKY